ncbi:MAG: hypothetical protein LBS97_02600 [Treponema sp.]|jgi:hypothetical protein|nr:hypothetical protein [Treponema sp.]
MKMIVIIWFSIALAMIAGIFFLLFDFLIPIHKEMSFVPMVRVSTSTDNGQNYYEDRTKVMPSYKPFYVKFTISVKSYGRLWSMKNNIVPLSIEYPACAEIDDYFNARPDNDKKADVTTELQKSAHDKQKIKVAKFNIVASAHPKKTEIIFYCEKFSEENNSISFMVKFDKPNKGATHQVHKAYTTKVTLRDP